MTGDSKNGNQSGTGGGVHVGGNLNTGGGDVVGRDKVTTAGEHGVAVGGNVSGSSIITGDNNVATAQQGVDQEALLQLLAEMRQLIRQSGLDERKARIIEADVQVVEDEAKADKPDSAVLASRLEGMTRVLKAAGGLTEAGKTLLLQADKALSWVGTLFP